jgi:4'-phosphopantetheinyl transferase
VSLASVAAICSALPDVSTGWLSESEQRRCEAMTAQRRRQQFLAGRWFLRQCLAQWHGGAASEYVLSAAEDGPPLLMAAPFDLNACPLQVSLSHSADWVACAVASHPIGVDVEDTTRQRDTDALGAMIHGEQEAEAVPLLDAATRHRQFYARWTLKEAWIKQAPDSPAMSAIPFEPCEAQRADAVVLRSPSWVLAVAPVRMAALQCAGLLRQALTKEPWRRCADV